MKLPKVILALVTSLAAFAGTARAIPTLVLYDWYNNILVTVVDGGGNDQWAGANVVMFAGTIGNWTVNVSTGIVTGTTGQPEIDLNSVNMSNGAGLLSIGFSADGFGPSNASVKAAIGGTTTGTVYYSTWADPTNSGYPGAGVQLTGPPAWDGPFGPGAFSYTSYGSISFPAFYSLSTVIEIEHFGSGVTSFDSNVTVPESGLTASLLGIGLLAAGLSFRRFKIRNG